jgi:hypothetical protein
MKSEKVTRMRLKYILIGAVVVAVSLLGGLWLFLRFEPPNAALDAFQQACIAGQRQNITGGITGATLPVDDETESKLLAYCDCVAREVGTRLSSQEIADIGLQQSNATVRNNLAVIFDTCRAANL